VVQQNCPILSRRVIREELQQLRESALAFRQQSEDLASFSSERLREFAHHHDRWRQDRMYDWVPDSAMTLWDYGVEQQANIVGQAMAGLVRLRAGHPIAREKERQALEIVGRTQPRGRWPGHNFEWPLSHMPRASPLGDSNVEQPSYGKLSFSP
jgi:hypothetical protein